MTPPVGSSVHDPLCVWLDKNETASYYLDYCELPGPFDCIACYYITRAREDERERATTAKATVHVCADNNCWCPKSLSRSELS